MVAILMHHSNIVSLISMSCSLNFFFLAPLDACLANPRSVQLHSENMYRRDRAQDRCRRDKQEHINQKRWRGQELERKREKLRQVGKGWRERGRKLNWRRRRRARSPVAGAKKGKEDFWWEGQQDKDKDDRVANVRRRMKERRKDREECDDEHTV